MVRALSTPTSLHGAITRTVLRALRHSASPDHVARGTCAYPAAPAVRTTARAGPETACAAARINSRWATPSASATRPESASAMKAQRRTVSMGMNMEISMEALRGCLTVAGRPRIRCRAGSTPRTKCERSHSRSRRAGNPSARQARCRRDRSYAATSTYSSDPLSDGWARSVQRICRLNARTTARVAALSAPYSVGNGPACQPNGVTGRLGVKAGEGEPLCR